MKDKRKTIVFVLIAYDLQNRPFSALELKERYQIGYRSIMNYIRDLRVLYGVQLSISAGKYALAKNPVPTIKIQENE